MENGLEKSKNVTKIVVNSTFAKCVTKIMVTKIKITKFIALRYLLKHPVVTFSRDIGLRIPDTC